MIASADIVTYISQFVDLERRGEEFWGLSPFKDEKTPSFSVRPQPPCFFDYSSGIGGNIFTFIKYYFHCSASEAVRKLEEYIGQDADSACNRSMMSATQSFRKFKRHPSNAKTASYTVLPDDIMSRYEKRSDKLQVWRNEGISDESLERFQVCYDAFSDRLVYPIRNPDGKIVNIGGRTLDPQWKEKKLRKYTYFYQWGALETIYGLSENMEFIKNRHEIILFEGAKSVLLADTWGIRNTGAILTSHLNPAQKKLLAKLGCRVVFALDQDVDVRKDHNIQKLVRYCNVDIIQDRENLLGEKDSPVDHGKEVFLKLYEQRKHYT